MPEATGLSHRVLEGRHRLPVACHCRFAGRFALATRIKTMWSSLSITAALLAAATGCGGASAQATAQKPDTIVIVSDVFGYGDSGVYGGGPGRGMPTPNLDRL